MTYKSYGNQKSTLSRMSRKRMRRDVFMGNKKMAKALRKAARLKQKLAASQEEVE